MNLIQQIQETPKWKEFEEWYNIQGYFVPLDGIYQLHKTFIEFPIEFQKGVFEKFIEQNSNYFLTLITSELGVHSITVENLADKYLFYSFEELLIWYFNN